MLSRQRGGGDAGAASVIGATAAEREAREAVPIVCADFSFPSIPHEAAIDLIAALGFDGFKLVLLEGKSHVQPHDVRTDIAGWAGRIEERVRSRGLDMVDVACVPDQVSLSINHPSESVRAEYRAFVGDMIEFVARLRAPTMMLQCGSDWESESHEVSFTRLVGELTLYVDAAAERGITLMVEPHVGRVCATPADAERLVDAVPGLRLAVDYSQFVSQGIDEIAVDELLAHAASVHVRGAAPGRLQAPLEESVIDYARIVAQLEAVRFTGTLALEVYEDRTPAAVDVLSETVALRDLLRVATRAHGLG
jgi:sugar phosphate isomerase/epimerase